jgi:hypothetical protein
MPLPPLNPALGRQVTTRSFSLQEMVERAWGSEFSAPDHGVYVFGGGARKFDSTDMGYTGFYQSGILDLQSEVPVPGMIGVYYSLNQEQPQLDGQGDPLLTG